MDGTELSQRRCELMLFNDPASGVMRHADAGYEEALVTARNQSIRIPMEGGG